MDKVSMGKMKAVNEWVRFGKILRFPWEKWVRFAEKPFLNHRWTRMDADKGQDWGF